MERSWQCHGGVPKVCEMQCGIKKDLQRIAVSPYLRERVPEGGLEPPRPCGHWILNLETVATCVSLMVAISGFCSIGIHEIRS